MFVNFHVSVAVIVELLARSRVPKSSEPGATNLPLIQLPYTPRRCGERALFLRCFEFGELFLILQNVCNCSRLSYCNCVTISWV